MERIKQAIEKVKNQRSSEAQRGDLRPEAAVALPKSRPARDSEELEDIRYIYTRVAKPPLGHLEKNRIVAFDKNAPKGMAFDLLRTQVLKKMEENGWRTLAITSPTPEAGKTVVAINLAMSIAQLTNKTAVLVDFDLRRPKIGPYLGIPMDKSLNDLLEETAELQEVLVNPGMPRLVVLPTKTPMKNSSETLSSGKIADLIKDLRERYKSRIVIFDLPPLLVTDDAIALLPQIDCILMVVANGMCTKREIEDSLQLLPAENLIGTILNKADIEPVGYYY
ncbi:MAG: CpsD/CapB family tyrosine-protein kinase [Gammaproteobacteria bacterium]|nr:CpsD/CapB family tyrosine-protein kinase [Gammaproteobacteria bacterium]MBU1776911.1 CpsD/CapB family tyrosine-protein kinase [Gammaproteobacteria bacterium]MBU1969723.1 CpsD/CapB family tyrosine-protein kinase [Gammaproteobacteria bacterium]